MFHLLPRLAGALLLASPVALSAQTYTWSGLAGLPPQWGTTNGTGSAARFFAPGGLIGSVAGNFYVADTGNFTIRVISSTGDVGLLSGTPGVRGAADGPASAARFSLPMGITLTRGLLFVADAGNHAIRQIGGNGAVVTFAGQLALAGTSDGMRNAARFNNPYGITADQAGNLYVADRGNHAIRKISPEGEVTTLAGEIGVPGTSNGNGTAARFNSPSAVTLGPDGSLYVADTGNHSIRRIAVNGTVSTYAGVPGSAGAVNGAAALSRFRFPRGVLAFSNGSLLVADQAHAIRLITADGIVSTYAGRLDVQGSRDGPYSDARFNLPNAISASEDGAVVADSANHTIRKLNFTTRAVSTIAGGPGSFGRRDGRGTEALFNYPNGVAIHASGDLYVADSRGNTIRRISPDGTVVQIAGGADDSYVDGPAGTASLNYPFGIAVAPDRTVYFTEQQRHTVRVLRPDGSVATLAGRENLPGVGNGTGQAALFNLPSGVALDRDGNLYVADTGNHVIRRLNVSTGAVTSFAGFFENPGSADGNGTAARFRFPRGVAIDAEGNVLVADSNNHTIRRISPAGDVTTVAGAPGSQGTANGNAGTARFSFPFGIAVDQAGIIYVSDTGNFTIRRIAGETVATIGGTAGASGYLDGTFSFFNDPTGIAVDRAGIIYVAEANNNVVRRGESVTAPAISVQPQAVAATNGGTATFTVTAAGGDLSYQWRFRGLPIIGANTATLTLPNVNESSAGDYSVVVTNSLGTVTSRNAALTIVAASDAGRIVNLSILTGLTEPGDSFTMGFVVGGTGTAGAKPLVLRAVGPSLGALGVADTVADPRLELFSGATAAGGNDNWGGGAELAAAMNRVGAFAYSGPASRDAATAGSFPPGNNSMKVSTTDAGTGTVIAEIYDATPAGTFVATTPRLVNVSVLKQIGRGLTAGFAIGGLAPKTVLIRAVGPTLGAAPFGVGGVVADPQLTLFSGQTSIGTNDNWGGGAALRTAFSRVGAFDLPADSKDAALIATLAPGSYTVQVAGAGGAGGIALVEIYEVP